MTMEKSEQSENMKIYVVRTVLRNWGYFLSKKCLPKYDGTIIFLIGYTSIKRNFVKIMGNGEIGVYTIQRRWGILQLCGTVLSKI